MAANTPYHELASASLTGSRKNNTECNDTINHNPLLYQSTCALVFAAMAGSMSSTRIRLCCGKMAMVAGSATQNVAMTNSELMHKCRRVWRRQAASKLGRL